MTNLEKLFQIAGPAFSKKAKEARERAVFNFMQLVPEEAKDLFKVECVWADAHHYSQIKLYVDDYVFSIDYTEPTVDKPGLFFLQNPITYVKWDSTVPFFTLVDILFCIAKHIEKLESTLDSLEGDDKKEALGKIQYVKPNSPLVN